MIIVKLIGFTVSGVYYENSQIIVENIVKNQRILVSIILTIESH